MERGPRVIPVGAKAKARANRAKPPICALWHDRKCPPKTWNDRKDLYNETNTFMNMPYLIEYEQMEIATWVTLKLHGLTPLVARDLKQSDNRTCKIIHLMWQCKYGISDFSFRRLNVAFEDMAMRQQGIQVISMSRSRKEFTRDISDLLSIDPLTHELDPRQLTVGLSEAIQQTWDIARRVDIDLVWEIYNSLMQQYKKDYGYRFITQFNRWAGTTLDTMGQQ